MTEIKLHGVLAKEYGESMLIDIDRARDVIRAIDCNKNGFRKRVIDLQKKGFTYDVLVDRQRLNKDAFINHKKPKTIDLVPVICGAGAEIVVGLVFALASVAISYALIDPGTIEGGEQVVSGSNESLIFQGGAANVASQGSPIPIGYGRMLVGSQIVQSSVKSFPQSILSLDVMVNNPVNLPNSNNAVESVSNKA